MWRPPENMKHLLPATNWPTENEAESSALFSPVHVGPIFLEQRTWVPAMVPWRASDEGFVTPEILEWYARFAEGQPGAIVVEATGIRDIKSGPLMRIGHDRFIPGLTELVTTVRKASGGHTRLFIQLIDFLAIRRRPSKENYFKRYLAITDRHRKLVAGTDEEIRLQMLHLPGGELERVLTARELESLRYGYRETVNDVHLESIRELPSTLPTIFGCAAKRAEAAGFDGVELHYAHAYTMASFLSALNTRQDGYGTSRENRLRLPREVYQSVRSRVSTSFAVGCRFLADECIEGGSDVDDAIYFGTQFASMGMDYISLSRGGKFEDAQQPKVGGGRLSLHRPQWV